MQELVKFDESPEELGRILTGTGLEVEGIEEHELIKGGLKEVVIGKVLTCEKHPNADKLSVTTVDVGEAAPLQIVCGAPNVAAGQTVLVAKVGAELYPTGASEPLKIKRAKIRGVESEGMICAEDELGIGSSHAGIMVLETELPVGTPAARYLDIRSDHTIEIGLTPNRADAASHYGVARDLKAALNKPVALPSVEAFRVDNHDAPIHVEVHVPEAAPRYSGITMTGLRVGESPDWLKHRLEVIGVRPINNIVDITNYVCHELGQPLHAFDYQKIAGQRIVVRTFEEGTGFKTLDGVSRKLRHFDLMIADAEAPMCIAGVFGGEDSGVSDATTSIFLESAYFSPEWVRRTAQHHGLKTDASFRFERGTDPNLPVVALKRAALLIAEIAGGKVSSEIIDLYPNPVENFRVAVKYKNIDRLIGKKLDRYAIQKILFNLDIRYEIENEEGFVAIVPPYRVDVQREADIIEEVLRIYGFDNVELSEDLKSDYLSPFPSKDPDELLLRTGGMLAANGFNEIINNSLVKPTLEAALADDLPGEEVKILNYLSEDLSILRRTLLFSALETVAHNLNRRQKNLKFFEFGKIYFKEEAAYREKNRLSIVMTGNQIQESWVAPAKALAFHDLALVVSNVLSLMRTGTVTAQKYEGKIFAQGIIWNSGNREVARLGLVSPEVARTAGVKSEVYFAELDWDYLLKKYSSAVDYREVSRFPEVRRDLSLVVDKNVQFDALEALAYRTEKKLIKEVNVFDVYEGKNLEGKKAYAISFTLLDDARTLTDQEIDRVMQKLMGAYEKEFGAIIRK
ncbi:phenylalanine--tRNA ligase subunit beta [Ravibacter arvi]|uniref:Phenylalanine--tRNA ligase beta subunit n=1 Tax=Ravibacter arvi TaxID=2051041 RepID=A0ABP8LYM4_9BACT